MRALPMPLISTARLFPSTPTTVGPQLVDFADEICTELAVRIFVQLQRSGHLHHLPVFHHRDAIGHRKRLRLGVGDDDKGDAHRFLQVDQFDLHGLPQLGIQGRQRLIQEQNFWFFYQGPGQGNPLLLPA